jgi:hypothetical protein
MKIQGKAAAFPCHGTELRKQPFSTELIGCCFVCEKEDHLYVNEHTGLWDCKSCGESGNLYQFLTHFHEDLLAVTSRTDYAVLSADRSLPQSIFRRHAAAILPTGDWILPAYATTGTIVNLYRWDCDTHRVYGTWGLPSSLFNLQNYRREDRRPVFVAEGIWDTYAVDHILITLKLEDEYDLFGIPGSSGFKPEWRRLLAGRDVILLHDHDAYNEKMKARPGDKGRDRTIKILSDRTSPHRPRSIQYLQWPSTTPDNYDIRDLIAKGIPK